ncbi:DHA2 family efflux MFS transporter permease subunit [Flexivirga caeni]|uniref:DHA2 family efflux MFS transporter permease subunit n=1 Tax=Flexivirga caeni TaxID=2294115 RepID=UPI0026A296EE
MSNAAPIEYPDKIDGAVLKVAGVVVLGAIMSILDITVVNVALPTFQRVFGHGGQPVAYSTVAWTVTAYTLALATVIPMTGWAADRFGTKRLYMLAIGLFTIGSALCALSQSIGMLIGFRVLQGLGGGMLMPLGMTIMTHAAGPKRMGRLMAILGVPMLLGPILGPILGGYLIEHASWHWIFLINLPIGVVALIYSWFALENDKPTPSESFDFVGMLMMSPGLALFLYGVSSIPSDGMGSVKVIVPAIIGIVLIVAFVFHTFRPQHPLLDLRLFSNRLLSVSTVTMFLFVMAFFGGLLLVPTYFQQIRGESTLDAGLLVAPQGIGALLTMPIAGALTDKLPVGRIVPVGLVLIIGGMFAMTQINGESSYWGYIIPVLFIMGLGMGATMMPIMTSALKTLRPHEIARGSTLINIVQQVGSSVGVAVMSTVLTNHLKSSPSVGIAQSLAEQQGTKHAPTLTHDQLTYISQHFPSITSQLPELAAHPTKAAQIFAPLFHDAQVAGGHAFGNTFWVAAILCLLTIVPALLLPRKPLPESSKEDVAPVMIH